MALEAVRLALANLDNNDITEIRSFATPPKAIQVNLVLGKATESRNRIKSSLLRRETPRKR